MTNNVSTENVFILEDFDSILNIIQNDSDVSDVDLSVVAESLGLDLKICFSGLDLTGVIFSGATIEGASFRYSDLTGADFSGCELRECCFEHTNLSNANFAAVKLHDCTFKNTAVEGANFLHAEGISSDLFKLLTGNSTRPMISVLIVEDIPNSMIRHTTELIEISSDPRQPIVEITDWAEDVLSAEILLKDKSYDLVLIDNALPQEKGRTEATNLAGEELAMKLIRGALGTNSMNAKIAIVSAYHEKTPYTLQSQKNFIESFDKDDLETFSQVIPKVVEALA